MADRPRVLVLGFDAAERSLVQRGIDEGWLPNIATAARAGRYVRLEPADAGAFPGAAWPTTITGTGVGKHGLFLDRQLRAGSYRIVHVTSGRLGRPPFWRYISDAGLNSTIVSAYSAPLLHGLRGTQVLGWGTADPYTTKFRDWIVDPPEVASWLDRSVGRRTNAYYAAGAPPVGDRQIRRYCAHRIEDIRRQARGLRLLMDQTEWDFFFGSFSHAHPAGHLLWQLADPDHPEHDGSRPPGVKGALASIYAQIDAGLGELLERRPEHCTVLLVTPHGMGPNQLRGEPLETALERGGWLVRDEAGATAQNGTRTNLRRVLAAGRRHVPARYRPAVGRLLLRVRERRSRPLEFDPARTRAFALPSDLVAFVRINLRGREPAGVVEPGAGYDTACRDLTSFLTQLVDADSGAPAVEAVLRGDELLGRPVGGPFPDLCVVWSRSTAARRLTSPATGTFEVPLDDPRTGQHRQQGFVVGLGPGIPSSGSNRLEGPSASLLDLAPTVLAQLGIEPPAALGGRPMELFSPGAKERVAAERR